MDTRLVVDKQEGLREFREKGLAPQPQVVRVMAKFFSYLFHPVFVPVMLVVFMVFIHPWLFAGMDTRRKVLVVIQAASMFTFFPLITVFLLKALDFVKSIQLVSQKDRIIPLVACGVWYFWLWYVWRNQPDYPLAAVRFALGTWISVSLALMANIVLKISLHTIAAGVMMIFMILLALSQELHFGVYLSIAFLVTGIVCTSRFIVSDHSPAEIYGGLLLGAISMLLANQFG